MKPRIASRRGFTCMVALAAATGHMAATQAGSLKLSVEAGGFDRINTIISFKLADCDCARPDGLIADDGSVLPLQVIGDNACTFILPSLKAGETTTFESTMLETPIQAQVIATTTGDRTELTTADGSAILGYQAGKGTLPRSDIREDYRRGGYIHPVVSPAGFKVTNDYPEQHVHHHGIWFPWTKTEFQGRHPDFWNMGDRTGRVEFVELDRSWSGPVAGGFQASHRFVDLSAPQPVSALDETWTVTIYSPQMNGLPYHVFDLESVQSCASNDPLNLPDYHYGGIGLRGLDHWLGTTNTRWLTSSGETERLTGNFTTGHWCHMYGTVAPDSELLAGTTIMGHPKNFRAPQPMRLHPKEPFFCFAPSQQGDWSIKPGESYTSRYRFFVFDGEPDKALIDSWWNDYANPPKVTVTIE